MPPNVARPILIEVEKSRKKAGILLKLPVDDDSRQQMREWIRHFQELVNDPQLPPATEAKLYALEREILLRFDV